MMSTMAVHTFLIANLSWCGFGLQSVRTSLLGSNAQQALSITECRGRLTDPVYRAWRRPVPIAGHP